ncbi:MAG TPA: hypothetical protein VLT84_01045, partial [Acidobacteriota bacterium]|nr:hypothetical protein [Acidobacteriota bacterium]
SGGRPTRAEAQRRAIQRMLRDLDGLEPRLLKVAVETIESPDTAPAVRAQLLMLIDKLQDRVETLAPPPPPPDHEREAMRDTLRRLLRLGLIGFVSVRDDVSSNFDGRSLAALRADFVREADAAEAERDRLRAALAEGEALRARLEAAELRPLRIGRRERAEEPEAAAEAAPDPGTSDGPPS